MGPGVAALLSLVLTVTPTDGGLLSAPQITINAGPGDQFDPHVDRHLAAYSSYFDPVTSLPIEQIRYYDFDTGLDQAIPTQLVDGGQGRDFLSDVDQGRIVFTRIFDDGTRSGILLFDTATTTVTELAPAPNTQRLGVALGAQTAAFIDYGLSGDGTGELVVLNLGTGATTRITNDLVTDVNPSVSPDGNTVVWERCPVSQANCDVYAASRVGALWTWQALSSSAFSELGPDTNGARVVFEREFGVGDTNLVLVSTSGGAETVLEIPGEEHNASIRGEVVAFEHREGLGPSDIWLVELATNRLFRVTETPTINETLNDVTVLPTGEVRVVWQANENIDANIYGATFSLPSVGGGTDAGVPTDAGVACLNRTVTLEATRTWSPSRWTDGTASFSPALDFAIPAALPVVAGNSGNKWASLSFTTSVGNRVVCRYRGGSARAHPTTPAELAAASRYLFSDCHVVRPGCGEDDDDDDEDDDDDGDDDDEGDDDDHGHGRRRGGAPHHGPGHRGWAAGDVVSATSITLHVHDGDNRQPMTRVRLTLAEVCSTSTTTHPLEAGTSSAAAEGVVTTRGSLRGVAHARSNETAGCASAGPTLLPLFAFAVLVVLALRPRRAAIRVVARQERRRLR